MYRIIGFKLFVDMFVFDPIYLAFFFTATNTLERKSWDHIKHKLKEELATTYLIDVLVWLPIQFLNFRYIPTSYQALVVQTCNIGWNAFLSFVQHR